MNNLICGENNCSACGACVDICPKKCIELKSNKIGNCVAIIKQEKCIGCNLCKKVCPQLNNIKKEKIKKCYAGYSSSKIIKLDSSSGGIASLIYQEFLDKKIKSKIVGVYFDEHIQAKMKLTSDPQDIELFKGSKYVQSNNKNIFIEIKQALNNNEEILFIGLPCQVSACINFMKVNKVNIDKLYTIDLICHGVSPQKYLNENLEMIKKKYNIDKINNLTFRSNRKFRNFHFVFESERNGHSINFNQFSLENEYFTGFLKGISLSESCYNCKYAECDRVSDMTIGDFIGLGKHEEFKGNPKNASAILVNNDKGLELFDMISPNIFSEERKLEELLIESTSLREPFTKSQYRDQFLKRYEKNDFNYSIRKSIGIKWYIKKVKLSINRSIKTMYMKLNREC